MIWHLMKHAHITSCDVERHFSHYQFIFNSLYIFIYVCVCLYFQVKNVCHCLLIFESDWRLNTKSYDLTIFFSQLTKVNCRGFKTRVTSIFKSHHDDTFKTFVTNFGPYKLDVQVKHPSPSDYCLVRCQVHRAPSVNLITRTNMAV